MPALIAALIVTLVGGVGTVYAAHDAQPGDALYGVRSAVEQAGIELPLAASTTARNNTAKAKNTAAGVSSGRGNSPHSSDVVSGTIGIALTRTLTDVAILVDDSQVAGNSENGLHAKLDAANRALERGQPAVAAHQFDAFLQQLNAFCRSGHITQSNYDTLYADYGELVAGAGGTKQAKLDSCGTTLGEPSVEGTGEGAGAQEQPGRSGEHRPNTAVDAGNSADHRQNQARVRGQTIRPFLSAVRTNRCTKVSIRRIWGGFLCHPKGFLGATAHN